MDSQLAKFARFTENDIPENCPKLAFNISIREEKVSSTLASLVIFNLRRENDSIQGPVSFSWKGQGDSVPWASFIFLQHTASGLQKVDVQNPDDHKPEDTSEQKVVLGNRQLNSGEEETFWFALPEQFHKVLIPGEKYTLYWPGAEVNMWKLGSLEGDKGQELTRDTEQRSLIIPAGTHITFEVAEEEKAWPDRAEVEAQHGFAEANIREEQWRRKNLLLPRSQQAPTPRVPGAPVLNVKVEGPGNVSWQEDFATLNFKLTMTYEGTSGNDQEDRPIVLHLKALTFQAKQLLRKKETGWEVMDPEDGPMLFVDDPDESVKVGEHEDFVSLKPGESWSWEENVGSGHYSMLPVDTKVGDVFRYTFLEDTVDWWHWGSKDDHADTVVKLPCFITGPVREPRDNDGRPELIIPTSNSAEVRVVGSE